MTNLTSRISGDQHWGYFLNGKPWCCTRLSKTNYRHWPILQLHIGSQSCVCGIASKTGNGTPCLAEILIDLPVVLLRVPGGRHRWRWQPQDMSYPQVISARAPCYALTLYFLHLNWKWKERNKKERYLGKNSSHCTINSLYNQKSLVKCIFWSESKGKERKERKIQGETWMLVYNKI